MSTIDLNDVSAKRSGQYVESIIDHSHRVGEFSELIARLSTNDEELISAAKIGGLLHDIGKCCDNFQVKNNNQVRKWTNDVKFRHNEIGWAFLANYLYIDNKQIFDYVIDSVYWHHGISNKMGEHFSLDILEHITSDDIILMNNFITEVLDDSFLLKSSSVNNLTSPNYFNYSDAKQLRDINSNRLFIRSCVISADRIVSKINWKTNKKTNIEIIEEYLNKKNEIILDNNHDYIKNNHIRFNNQLDIISKTKQTTIIKAPSGFGKTLIGLIWGATINKKKIIWVCPRNTVATGVYQTILNEIKILNLNLSVELYLTGLVQKSTHNSEGFESDIIITNIDNYLAPSINNNSMDKLFLINDANVVFDEYHELTTDVALFSSFINLMRCRHRLTNSNTLLLSATPIKMDFLWNSMDRVTTILPNIDQHYPAEHSYDYDFKITDELEFNDDNSLVILNSISNSQKYLDKLNLNKLIHNDFELDYKQKFMENLFNDYGKYSVNNKKESVVSAPIIQASLDISFKNLYESVNSPESTLQRIGRCNRWGECKDSSSINLFRLMDKNEKNAKLMTYDENLSKKWFDFLMSLELSKITLDVLYMCYNKFNKDNEILITAYVKNQYNESLKYLKDIYPKKYTYTSDEGDSIKIAGSNKLRSTSSEIFFIVEKHGTSEFTDIFSTKTPKDFYIEEDDSRKFVEQSIKKLKNDSRFNFKKIIEINEKSKKNIVDLLKQNAKKSDTPFIVHKKVYHERYGLISKKNLSL